MTLFAGFPSGKNPYVPVPEVFFTELLPEIEDTAELDIAPLLVTGAKTGRPALR